MKYLKSYIFVSFLLILACTLPQEPKLPQWQIRLENIPLMAADTVVIGNEFSDSNLVTDADNLYHLWFSGSEQIDIADQLKLEALNPDPINGQVDAVSVNGNPGQSIHVPLFEAFPALRTFNNTNSSIPSQTIFVRKSLDLENFYSVTLASGIITLEITNNLAFPLGKPITVSLYDRNTQETISEMVFEEYIPNNGGSKQASLDLGGETLTNALDVIINGSIKGTSGELVNITDNQSFDVEVSMSNLVAIAAEAKIPSQSFFTTHELDLSTDSLVVNSAQISSGVIRFDIQSEFYLPVRLDLTLPGVLDQSFNPLQKQFTLLSRSSEEVSIDLTDKEIHMKNGLLELQVETTLLPDAEDYVHIHAGDKYNASASVSELRFSQVTANVNLATEFPRIEQDVMDTDVELPDIEFDDARFTLDFKNVPANMYIDLNLDAQNNVNETATANYSFSVIGGSDRKIQISNTGVFLDGSNIGSGGGLMDVINIFPESFLFTGNAGIRDEYATLTGDPIMMDYQLDVPFVFSVPENTVLTGDTTDLDFDDDDRDLINNIEEISLVCKVKNGLCLGGDFHVRVADYQTARDLDISQWPLLSTLHLDAAELDADGNLLSMSEQLLETGLDSTQIDLLTASDLLTWTVDLDPVEKARLKSTDCVILENISLNGNVTVNKPEDN